MTTLVWFRQDLRLSDNAALTAALQFGEPVVPLYIFAPDEEGIWSPGAASRWWLHHSLRQLGLDLQNVGVQLCLRSAQNTQAELLRVARECGASRIVWNRRYEPAIIARDQVIKAALTDAGFAAISHNSALLFEPWSIKNKTGKPYQVFTPFWRQCLSLPDPHEPTPAPKRIPSVTTAPQSQDLDELTLLPRLNWASGFATHWTPGAASAHECLQQFLATSFEHYQSNRDRPALRATSRLSPHLHFGEIGPREVWHATRKFAQANGQHTTWRRSHFLFELGWREFAHHLLFYFPDTPTQALRANYARFPWKSNLGALNAWQRGATGYPIVDAGMRELWHTGWMHNRVRMIAASFLVKDLLLSWQQGAHWFWDTLVDADLASNTLGWQWVSGCGADAAPYFRIFNPTTQALKFDPQGVYVRRWVPEIAQLPDSLIHQPWAATPEVLKAAGVTLGKSYPLPIVQHDIARLAALAALATLQA